MLHFWDVLTNNQTKIQLYVNGYILGWCLKEFADFVVSSAKLAMFFQNSLYTYNPRLSMIFKAFHEKRNQHVTIYNWDCYAQLRWYLYERVSAELQLKFWFSFFIICFPLLWLMTGDICKIFQKAQSHPAFCNVLLNK